MHIEINHFQGAAVGIPVLSPIMLHNIPSAVERIGETYLDHRDIAFTSMPSEDREAITVQGHVVQLFHVKVENGHVIWVRAHEIATHLAAYGAISGNQFRLTPIGFDHRASGSETACAIVTMTYNVEREGESFLLHEDIHLFLDDDGNLRSIVDQYEIES